MRDEELLEKVEKLLEEEPRLVDLPSHGEAVFVGDTHGDLDATQRVIDHYLKKPYVIVFLGDYVDRGELSRENILYLLRLKWEHPDQLFLLAGNHEGYNVRRFSPSNFWESLSTKERDRYDRLFSKLPLAATSHNGILALHGGLPELRSLEEINQVEWGDDQWDRIVWGDFSEADGDILGDLGGRPQFGRQYFDRMMDRYQKQILIRSHQPHCPLFMFQKRCVTIFTSRVYLPIRTIAIADMEEEIRTTEDVTLQKI